MTSNEANITKILKFVGQHVVRGLDWGDAILKRAFLNKLYVYIHTYIKFLSVWMNMYIKIVYEFYVVIPRPFSLRNQYTS